jgi:NHS family xanthosine MFS transporter
LLVWFSWGGAEFGRYFNSGIASIIMPALTGIIADRWINAEKLYGILHILSGLLFLYTAS